MTSPTDGGREEFLGAVRRALGRTSGGTPEVPRETALSDGEEAVRARAEAATRRSRDDSEALLAELSAAGAAVSAGLEGLSPERLADPVPGAPAQHQGKSVEFFLIQLCCHLAWHRGQLNYVRRILGAGAARS